MLDEGKKAWFRLDENRGRYLRFWWKKLQEDEGISYTGQTLHYTNNNNNNIAIYCNLCVWVHYKTIFVIDDRFQLFHVNINCSSKYFEESIRVDV